jgi:D-alanyl-D-alanine endopeptidase (penicillin-binding protein 7)
MRLLLRSIATALVLGLFALSAWTAAPLLHVGTPGRAIAGIAPLVAGGSNPPWRAAAPVGEWLPPAWFPPSQDLLALPAIDERGPSRGPSVRARSALVFDVDQGRVLYEKRADEVRPVASITKVVSALAYVSLQPDMEREVCVGAEFYPTRSGARSRLSTGDCTTGWDLLGAALVSSDNRAALGLAVSADVGLDGFVARMDEVSADLGMSRSSWSEPSGLEDENLSTARDIAKATFALASHPLLAPVASAPYWDLHRSNRAHARRLFSTDRLAGREDLAVEAAKTGYTDTARYCFTTVVSTDPGRRLVITLLGAEGRLTRWADVSRVLDWVERG